MFIPGWALLIIFFILTGIFFMVVQLFTKVKRLRKIIRKLENPEYDEHDIDTGDVEGR